MHTLSQLLFQARCSFPVPMLLSVESETVFWTSVVNGFEDIGIKDINSGNICMKKPTEDKLESHQEGDHKTASNVVLGAIQILEFWINQEKSLQ